jgi:hypothetical protein
MAQFVRVADSITQILIVISQEFLLHLAAERAECRKAFGLSARVARALGAASAHATIENSRHRGVAQW